MVYSSKVIFLCWNLSNSYNNILLLPYYYHPMGDMNQGFLLFLFCRLEPGFRHVRIRGSGRSAFVIEAQDDEAKILVNQPSDCLALQVDHIVCTEVDNIDVWFGFKFTSRINGPEHPEPPEVWQTALHHLLSTYKPRYCYLHTGGTETGLGEEVNVVISQQESFSGFWDDEHDVLSIKR